MQKNIICSASVLILLLFIAPAQGAVIEATTPASYVEALESANRFLLAWVMRDADVGPKLISSNLLSKIKKENNETWFRLYMSGLSNPHHMSFEIWKGKIINPKRVVFPVILYEYYTGGESAFQYKSKMEVIKEGDSWLIDVLPVTSDSE